MASHKAKPQNEATRSFGVIRVERKHNHYASKTMESALTVRIQIEVQKVPASKRKLISKSKSIFANTLNLNNPLFFSV